MRLLLVDIFLNAQVLGVFVIMSLFASCSSSDKKQIVAVVEKCPNYIFHLTAVAKLGFDSEYADIYKSSVLQEDIDYLKKHKDLLCFSEGRSGELVEVMIFFPSYINLESAEAFEEYFSLLSQGFQTNDFQPFLKRYASYNEKLKAWSAVEEEYLGSIADYKETIAELGKIYLRNFAAYENEIWGKEKAKLDKVASKINAYFKDKDIIAKWETLTKTQFKFNHYHIVLCSAIKNGPNANSLGYDRVVFYHDTPFDYLTQFISHETGTHILIDAYKEVWSLNQFDLSVLYRAYESLAKFYNTEIFKNKNLVYNLPEFHDEEYLRIYDGIYARDHSITPKHLLLKGIELFRNQNRNGKINKNQ